MTAHPPGESGPAPNQSTTTVVDDTARLDKQELAVRETDVSAPHEARLAPIRIFFLGIAMLLTYFLGVRPSLPIRSSADMDPRPHRVLQSPSSSRTWLRTSKSPSSPSNG